MTPARAIPIAVLLVLGLAIAGRGASGADAPADPLARLACRVVKVEGAGQGLEAAVLTVEVRNGGTAAVEPIAFEVRGRPARGGGAPWTRLVRRMPDPVHGRAGRVAPPGGTATYPIAVGMGARALAGATVRVARASFPSALGPGTPPIDVRAVSAERVVDEAGASVWQTTIEAQNKTDLAIDAVFLALCEEPAEGRLLLLRRFAPGERATWTVREVALEAEAEGAPRVTGVGARRVTLVDWSAVVSDGAREAQALLATAWERWIRWEEPFPSVRGTFRARHHGTAGVEDLAGTFTLDPSGQATCETGGPSEPASRARIERAVADAFAPMRRASAAQALPPLAPTLMERAGGVARVHLRGPIDGTRGPAEVHRIEDGVLRGWASPEAEGSIREVWTTEPRGVGYVVTARELFQSGVGGGRRPSDARRWTYAQVGPRLVPRTYARSEGYVGDRPTETTLDLLDVVVEGEAVPRAAPDAPPEVRAAWDAAYRYPEGAVTLSARFVAENAGTDAVWRGVRRMAGQVTLHGFTGMRGPGRSWRDTTVVLEEVASEELRQALAAALVDRLWIWAHRDFGGRDAFDDAFRGARVTVRAGAPGLYDVVNGPCTTLEIGEGRIVAWDPPTLGAGRLGYARVGDRLVHTSLTAGTATSTVTWTDLGGGWLFPATMRFERTLDAAWGPETVILSDVRWSADRAK